MPEDSNAAERFRSAVDNRDLGAMVATMAPAIELHSPTTLQPVVGRDRVERIFAILAELFEDFEYVRTFEGRLVTGEPGIVSSHALMFRCMIEQDYVEGIDVLDLNEADRIARFTVLIRPMSGLHKLADSIAQRMREGGPARR